MESWYGLPPGEIQALLSSGSRTDAVDGVAGGLAAAVVPRSKISDPGYPSIPTILSRLDDDRLVEILHAIAAELGSRAKHDDDPTRLVGATRIDLNEDLAEIDQDLG